MPNRCGEVENIAMELVRKAVMHPINRKTWGIDGMVSAVVESGGEAAVEWIWEVCNDIMEK